MTSIISRFRKNESGATAIEYGMIVGLIAVVIIGTVATLGPTLNGYFTSIDTQLKGSSTTSGTTSGS